MSLNKLIEEGEEALRRMRSRRGRKTEKKKATTKKRTSTKRTTTTTKRTTTTTKRTTTKRKTTSKPKRRAPKKLPKNRRYMIQLRDGRWRFASAARYKSHKGKKKVVQLD